MTREVEAEFKKRAAEIDRECARQKVAWEVEWQAVRAAELERERIRREQTPVAYRRSRHVAPEREADVLAPGPDGLPTFRLLDTGGALELVTPDGEVINPKSRSLYRLGIYCFAIRGTAYREEDARAGDFRPGGIVTLVREPENEHDRNAVAVYAPGASRMAGYVNRQNAARVAKRLDAGERLVGIVTCGEGPGRDGMVPRLVVCTPALLGHLTRA